MNVMKIAFIGSGRATAFLLEGFGRAEVAITAVLTDLDPAVSAGRTAAFPRCVDAGADFSAAAAADVVFLALHPTALVGGAASIAGYLQAESIVVSLAPKVTIAELAEASGSSRIARFLPSAPSAVGEGYNPVAFSSALPSDAREALLALLGTLGTTPEVEESTIEAYAVLCAMGPTYLWPLFDEMAALGVEFGLTQTESRRAVSAMAFGAAELFGDRGRSYAALMDMIPGKPMAEAEGQLRATFAERLRGIHGKLKG